VRTPTLDMSRVGLTTLDMSRINLSTQIANEGGSPPLNTSPPVASGNVRIGATLAVTSGTWLHALVFFYQWLRDGAPIAGATAPSYTVVSADVSALISCSVVAVGPGGVSAPVVGNSLANPWQPILALKANTLLWDGLDPYCYGGVAVGDLVSALYTVTGQLLATQGLTAQQATRTATMLDFDGIDDMYDGEVAYADYFDADQTYTAGTSGLTNLSSEWFMQATGGSNNRHWLWSNIAAPSRNVHRTNDAGAVIGGFAGLPQTQAVVWTLGTPGSGELYDLTASTSLFASVAPAAMILRPMDTWAIGGNVAGTLCCPAKLQHFAMDDSAWTSAQLDVYRTCAVNAGAI